MDNFFDEPLSTVIADQQPKIVELPPAATRALAPTSDGPRDAISPLLPSSPPQGRDLNRLAMVARQVGERLGVSTTTQGQSRAIYSFPAGNSRIEGPTVWLIGALWQEWGHVVVDSQVREERNGRVAITTTIVDRINGTAYRREHHTAIAPAPARFAKNPEQSERWNAMQLQSAISKAERTTVQHFLPGWYVDLAVEAARAAFGSKVLGGKSLAEARNACLDAFNGIGVSPGQLEEWVGAEVPLWTVTDIGDLRGLYRQIKAGELSAEGVFGSAGSASTNGKAKEPAAGGLEALKEPKRRASKPATTKAAEPTVSGNESAQLTEAEKADIIRREREEAEREAAMRDRMRGD